MFRLHHQVHRRKNRGEDISLLQAIKAVLHYGMKNEGRISLEQYNMEPDEAENRVRRGEFYTQEEVEKMSEKW